MSLHNPPDLDNELQAALSEQRRELLIKQFSYVQPSLATVEMLDGEKVDISISLSGYHSGSVHSEDLEGLLRQLSRAYGEAYDNRLMEKLRGVQEAQNREGAEDADE